MACQIVFNADNKISKVLNPEGNESQLFNQIAKLPHIESLEDALEIYKSAYGKNEVEPKLSFKSNKGNYNTFKEALDNSYGGDIEVIAGEQVLAEISSNTNTSEKNGLINNLIKEGILSDERIIEDGKSYLKSDGYDQIKQVVNDVIVKDNAPNVKIYNDGRIEIVEKEVFTDNSELGQQMDKIYEVVKAAQPKPLGIPLSTPLNEQSLKDRLTNFLNSLGVEITSIEKYKERYGKVNGVDPSAEALADISNQIIAFKNGEISMDNLSEETAHFIVEAWDEAEIENILRNIHKTDTYQKQSQTYREIYQRENPNMSAEEIENLVRKEILGKELANALVTRFNTEGKTESQVNILQRIYDLLVDFFNKITLQGNYQEQLNDLTGKVEDLLISQDLSKYLDVTQYKNKKFRLYNVPKANSYGNLLTGLIAQEKVLLQLGRGSTTTLKKLEASLDSAVENKALTDFVGLAKRQVRYVSEAIDAAERRKTTLSNEENIVFRNLLNVIRPSLTQLNDGLKKDSNYKSSIAEMKETVDRIDNIEGKMLNSENDILDRVVDRLIERYNLSDGTIRVKDSNGQMVDMNVKDYLKNSIKATQEDTNMLYSYFGQITHASDPLLNLLGSVIGDMYIDKSREFQHIAKNYQANLRKEGFKEKDLAQLAQDDGYLISQWDFKAFEEFKKYAKAEAYKNNLSAIIANLELRQTKGEDVTQELETHRANDSKSKEELLKDFKGVPVISDEKLSYKVSTEISEKQNEGTETTLSEAYMKEQKKLYDDLGISTATRIALKGFSELRGQIKRNTITSKSGTPIYTLQNKYDLEYLNLNRRKASSPYDIEGNLKKGLSFTDYAVNADSVEISNGTYLNIDRSVADEEAIISYDMSKMTRDFINKKNATGQSFNEKLDRTTHQKFYEDLEAMEQDPEVKREDILSFFNLNTQVGFSKEFFEGEREDIFAEFEDDDAVSSDIKDYKDLLAQRRAVVNQYKDPNNGVNILAENIPTDIKKDILDNTRRIETLASGIFMYIKGKNKEKAVEIEREAETGANEAYFGALKDNNLITFDEKLKFTLEHMTDRSKKKVEEFKMAVESGQFTSKLDTIIDKYGTTEEGVLKYAQSKLLPYYASYAPKALQEFYDKARNSNESMLDLIEELNNDDNVRISVSFDYLDNQDPNILNPHKLQDFKGGYQQPTLRKQPVAFGKQFDFKNSNWDRIANDAKLRKLYDMHLAMHEGTLEMLGEKGSHNTYLLPQVSKQSFEKAESIIKGINSAATASEFIKELVNFRADDTEIGAQMNGKSLAESGVRIIPKYYLNKVENVSDVSKDLFHSSMMMLQQATLYKHRVRNYADIAALYDAVSSNNRSYPNGKAADATNTYKMFKSFMDANLFGVSEQSRIKVSLPIVGETELTKIIKLFNKYRQHLALAMTPIIPATSWLTAHSGLFTERLVGRYVDSDSLNRAMREMKKLSSAAITEGLTVNSTSRLSILGEYLGAYDLDKRYANSKYNAVTRFIGKAGYGMHTMGNFLPLGQAVLTVLNGNRVYAGKVLDYNQFSKIEKNANQTTTDSDIKAKWKTLKPLYDYMNTDNGVVEYSSDLYSDLNVTPEEFKNMENGIINKSKSLIERIDGNITEEERTIAQRHALLSFFTTHRGWLSITMANRFKRQHLNLKTGQIEQGSYVTLGKYIKNVIDGLSKKDWTAFKTQYDNSTDSEKLDMRRVAMDLAILTALYGIKILLGSMADDDPDSYIKQLGSYLADRVANETASSSVGVPIEFYKAVKEPLVAANSLENIAKVHEAFSSDVVKTGRYAGLSERERYAIKNITGAKAVYDLWEAKNLKSQHDSYKHFQDEDWFSSILSYLLEKSKE